MKLLFPILFFCSSSYGQTSDSTSNQLKDSVSKYFIVGDRGIYCPDCKVDFCNNLINSKGDTLGIASSFDTSIAPIYFTSDKILLSPNVVKILANRDKVKSINIYRCNEGRALFKDLAKNGIILLELKDTIIKSQSLFYFIKLANPNKEISGKNVYINGLLTQSDDLRYPASNKMSLYFDSKKQTYDIEVK